jgi:hypothetical protein
MDAIDHLGLLMKGPPPPPKKKGKNGDDKDAKGCPDATGDEDKDGVPNSLDESPEDAKGDDESHADETAGPTGDDAPTDEEAALDEELPDEEMEEDGFLPPEEEDGEVAPGIDPALAKVVDDIASAEKDFYAARGMHGPDHHKAELAMETFHKLVRKLAKIVHPEVGRDGGAAANGMNGNGPPMNGDGPPMNGNGNGPPPPEGEENGGPPPSEGEEGEGPPEEIIKEAKKAGWSEAAIGELFKAYEMIGKQDMLEAMTHDKLKGKMEPDPANFSGDPNGGQFIDWNTSSLMTGHMNEAGGQGEPGGISGDNPYAGSGAGEAHPHLTSGTGAKPAGVPFGKMGETPPGPPFHAKQVRKPTKARPGSPSNPIQGEPIRVTPRRGSQANPIQGETIHISGRPPSGKMTAMDYVGLGAKMRDGMHGKQESHGRSPGFERPPQTRPAASGVTTASPRQTRTMGQVAEESRRPARAEQTLWDVPGPKMHGKQKPSGPGRRPSGQTATRTVQQMGRVARSQGQRPAQAWRAVQDKFDLDPRRRIGRSVQGMTGRMSGEVFESAGGLDYAYLGAEMRGGMSAKQGPVRKPTKTRAARPGSQRNPIQGETIHVTGRAPQRGSPQNPIQLPGSTIRARPPSARMSGELPSEMQGHEYAAIGAKMRRG